jgi:hypothetical protein
MDPVDERLELRWALEARRSSSCASGSGCAYRGHDSCRTASAAHAEPSCSLAALGRRVPEIRIPQPSRARGWLSPVDFGWASSRRMPHSTLSRKLWGICGAFGERWTCHARTSALRGDDYYCEQPNSQPIRPGRLCRNGHVGGYSREVGQSLRRCPLQPVRSTWNVT